MANDADHEEEKDAGANGGGDRNGDHGLTVFQHVHMYMHM